jgi:conjugative transfer region protein TrbK
VRVTADLTFWVRVGAALFAGSAVLVAVLTARLDARDQRESARVAAAAPAAPDPLPAELARCSRLTDPAQVDDACRRAWAEQRRRFFSPATSARP